LNVLDEIYMIDTDTYKVCEEFYARVKPKLDYAAKMHVHIYGDPAGQQRKSSSSKTDWQIVRDFFRAHANEFEASFYVASAAPTQKDRVNAVNALACASNRVRRLAVHERCKELIKDLEEQSWSMDSNENILAQLSTKDKMRGHLADALGYMIYQSGFNLLRGKVGEVRMWAQ
jgi:hypothetical protein